MTDEAVVDSAPDTLAHIARVGDFMAAAVSVLVRRASRHDASKLMEPEKEAFDIATPKLAGLAYGSEPGGRPITTAARFSTLTSTRPAR